MRFFRLVQNDLLLIFKSRTFLLVLVLLPVLLASISAITSDTGGYSDLRIGIINEDKTFIGLFFIQYASSMLKGENIIQLSGREEIDSVINILDGVFIIPRGFANKLLFQEPSELIFIPNPGSMQTAVALYQVLSNVLREFKALPVVADPEFMKTVDIDPNYVAPSLTVEGISESKLSFSSLLFPIVLVTTLMFMTSIGAATGVFEDRRNGVIDLLRLSNIGSLKYIGAKVVSFMVFSTAQVLIFMIAGSFFGLEIASNILLYLAVIEVYIFLFTSIGLLIGTVLNSSRSAQLTSISIVTTLLVLSGIIVPHSMFPDWLESFSRNLPTTSLLVLLQGISMLDFSLSKAVIPSVVNLSIAVVITIIAGLMTLREDISLAD
ncbi:MAG: ABC transporter permease [Mesotoga sp.]|uniref:ABC transporter permease n=1 Tax=Mesotoga sp. TaxID=2053577 RepID=UPI0016941EA7|nr:ABC transporter permease [Mesotoga sp.]NLT44910.1 ABC transporter permease [Thermotogaceae bacterium]MDD2333650.1 ABC transporter permease [Mesotoga sp.]MDD3680805.1 ABC transporter permease [Mesotoga sp.]MDD4206870.1 ABC transporter permease [Mesotoga sp.]MDD4825293.1 ABC transporter permease [Mesotoga sp.]